MGNVGEETISIKHDGLGLFPPFGTTAVSSGELDHATEYLQLGVKAVARNRAPSIAVQPKRQWYWTFDVLVLFQ